MPGSNCAIADCKASSSKCSNLLTFHQLPTKGKNDEWRNALIVKINRSDKLLNPDRAKICSRHFTENCFKYGMLTWLLPVYICYYVNKRSNDNNNLIFQLKNFQTVGYRLLSLITLSNDNKKPHVSICKLTRKTCIH